MMALGLGWIGGSNSDRLLNLKPVWPALQQKINSSMRSVASRFQSVWNETVASSATMAGRAAPGKMADQNATSETPNAREVPSRMANELDGRLVNELESSRAAAPDLTIRVEQLREATGRSQQEIVAGIARLGERLERVENQLTSLSATKTAPPVAQHNTSPAKPVQRLTPGATARISPRLPSAEAYPDKRQNVIEGWTIQEIFGDTAILAGPDGIRKVSPGDTVPGVGRVDSIVRRGSRWVVTTSRGVIKTDQVAP
jgi:hypothetical protein